jgi:hypothetical protein
MRSDGGAGRASRSAFAVSVGGGTAVLSRPHSLGRDSFRSRRPAIEASRHAGRWAAGMTAPEEPSGCVQATNDYDGLRVIGARGGVS